MRLPRAQGRFNHRAVTLVSLLGLSVTLAVLAAVDDSESFGATMLLPWVVLFAFEAGPIRGLIAAVGSCALFLIISGESGVALTPTFIFVRAIAFVVLGGGVGLAGEKLRQSERTRRRLVEGLPLVMYTESGGGLTYISPQIESLIGYPARTWLSEPNLWRRALHPDDRDRVVARYEAAVASGVEFECDYRLVTPDGRAVWVRDSSACVSDGDRSYRQGFIVDVTQLKESEARAERNATLMRALIDGTIDGITFTDRDGRIVVANEPMVRFAGELGFPQSGLMHERLLALTDRMVDPDRFAQRMRELAVSPDVESADEFELRESERVFQGFTRPVIGSDDSYLGRVWTLREVTEARQVDRIKDALVATVSHELRTPLTSIIGYLELLGGDDGDLTAENARYVEIVRRNAERLQGMVEELLFIARVEAGGLPLEAVDVDVVELAHGAIGSATPAASAKGLTLEFDGAGSARTSADAHRIGQVFDNLISNAIKFTDPGGSIKVSVRVEGFAIVATVADNGCGIPKAEQPRLFERFFRSSATSSVPGTGLGLTIARAIVDGHGGEITCRTDEGVGTTFTFSLPVRSDVEDATSRAPLAVARTA